MPLFPCRLPERSETEICEAIQECAKRSLEQSDPQGYARACVAKLIQRGWSDADAGEVLSGVLGVIARLSGIYSFCAPQFSRCELTPRGLMAG
jgi:hypothetical protein